MERNGNMSSTSEELLTDELMYFDQDSQQQQQQQRAEAQLEDEEEEEEGEEVEGVEEKVKKRKRRRAKNINVRTLFVSGLPLDTKPRELHLLFISYEGFKGSLLKQATKDGVECNPVAFVMFEKREHAEAARIEVDGITFDPDLVSTIKVDFAKANTKSTKPQKAKRQHHQHYTQSGAIDEGIPVQNLGPPPPHPFQPITYAHTVVMPTTVALASGGSGCYANNGYEEVWQQTSYNEIPTQVPSHHSHITYSEAPIHPHHSYEDSSLHHHQQHQQQQFSDHLQQMPQQPYIHFQQQVSHHHHPLHHPQHSHIHPHATFTMVPLPHPHTHSQPMLIPHPIPPPPAQCNGGGGILPISGSGIGVLPAAIGKEKKWTTLFVGNIPKDVGEDDLEELFSRIPSFRRLKMVRNKDTSTVAFVQYLDHISAGQAKNLFHGQTLGSNDNQGIRIEFAKTPMIEGSVKLNDKK